METITEILAPLSPISPSSLLEEPRKVESPVYLVLLGIFLAAFVMGILLVAEAGRLSRGNRLHQRLIGRYGAWAAWLGGVGMIAIGLRYTQAPMFSKRLWTFLTALAMLAVAMHFAWYRIARYPAALTAYREEERKRRFLPARRPIRPARQPRRRR